ncbi:MAG: hypothetical protein BGO98_12420 [Myxococcales bacterium 68-20]|nr:MAG: hypothetical protein BGO98_12420 [Myxococcales bacterium 68-20]
MYADRRRHASLRRSRSHRRPTSKTLSGDDEVAAHAARRDAAPEAVSPQTVGRCRLGDPVT